MSASNTIIESNLPWVEGPEDKLFKRLLITLVVLFLIAGIVLNSLTLPPVEKKQLADVSPRLAKLILQKKKIPPPVPIKKEEKKIPEKKVVKPKKQNKPKTPEVKKAAKEVAQQSGLIALSDELADLRESFDFEQLATQPQIKADTQTKPTVDSSRLLSQKASKGSGGIQTSTINRKITNSELAQRQTGSVKSSIENSEKIQQQSTATKSKSALAARNSEEIERVFQKNKGSLFNIYNRALRKDPSLQGKLVLELTIAGNGSVTKCVVVSSELNDQRLEKRIVSKVKKFKFANLKVPAISVTYPIDFLPS